MLNISENSIKSDFSPEGYKSFDMIYRLRWGRLFLRILGILSGIFLILLFLPWTQNIQTKGYVTTRYPDQRPQTIHSIIGGRIEKWYVKEGDFVEKGDTIIFISETKAEYFDPELVNRTSEQLKNKVQSIESYDNKIETMSQQLEVFKKLRDLKMEQGRNKLRQAKLKVKSDSIDLSASQTQYEIAEVQFKRNQELYNQGLKSLTDVETRKLRMQESLAKVISQENKLLASKNDVINAQVELSNIENEFREKYNKTESEQFSVISEKLDAASSRAKLENELTNYSIRRGMYYITAPMDGYVTQLIRSGLGETIKEGESIVSIMPEKYDLAVEFYVAPLDYPLIKKNGKIRIQFDGWPAIFFRGWPNTSFGTYGGKVVAIDNFISPNGMYRVLAVPLEGDKPWPTGVRVGGGAKSFALLNDVPIWYELWRNLNGFPPEYYTGPDGQTKTTNDEKSKK